MRAQRTLFVSLLLGIVCVMFLVPGTVWAVPVIEMFNAKTTSPIGNEDKTFRIREEVKYIMTYQFTATNPKDVTLTVRIKFADSGCTKRYRRVKTGVTPDEQHRIVIKRRIPECASVANWIKVDYTIDVHGKTQASTTSWLYLYPPLEPAARFVGQPKYGEVPLTVHFTNKSLGPVDTLDWNFGGDPDGVLSGPKPDYSPIYTYNTPGTYSVSLSISGPNGSDTKTKTDYITVVDPATVLDARFRAPRSERAVLWEGDPITVHFVDRSIGNRDTWEWDFSYDEGEGFNVDSTDQNPIYDYAAPGLYSVALKVKNSSTLVEDQRVKLNYIYMYDE